MKIPLALSLAALSAAALPHARAAVDFDKDVKPILENNCVRCHNPKGTDFEEGKTDVDLTTNEAAFEVVSTIVPGKPEKSKLYTTTVLPDDAKKLMPPKNKVTGTLERLTAQQTETAEDLDRGRRELARGATLVARKKRRRAGRRGWRARAGERDLPADRHHPAAGNEKGMQPYTTTIAGTDVTFDMVPIPGGKFKMGSPDNEAGRKPDEGPHARGGDRALLDGQMRGHLERIRALHVSRRGEEDARGEEARSRAQSRSPTPSPTPRSPTWR